MQAVLAGGLVVLGVVAERFFGFELERRQWAGLVLTAVGLALLAVTGEARSGQDTADYSIVAMLAFEAALVGIGAALIVSCRDQSRKSQHGILLRRRGRPACSPTTHVAVKALQRRRSTRLVAEVLVSPYLYIALLGGVDAFFASARSLQLGPAVPVIAVTAIAGNASAIPAGIVVFGDPVREPTRSRSPAGSSRSVLVIAAAALSPRAGAR